MYQLEEIGAHDHGPCECCGGMHRMVSGLIYRDGDPRAGFQIHWTPGQAARHGAEFYFFVGRWGEGTEAADRVAVALHYGEAVGGFAFMVVNAGDTSLVGNDLATRLLSRDEVIGTSLAREVFDIVDFIWLNDRRIADITGLDSDGAPDCECIKSDPATHASNTNEEAQSYFEIPGFGDGHDSTMATPVTTLIEVTGVWLLGGLFFSAGVSVLLWDSSSGWGVKIVSALTAVISAIVIARCTRGYFAGRRKASPLASEQPSAAPRSDEPQK